MFKMAEEYVTKDLFNEVVRRIEDKIDASNEKMRLEFDAMRADNEAFKAEIKAQNYEFREYITKDMNTMHLEIGKLHADIDGMKGLLKL